LGGVRASPDALGCPDSRFGRTYQCAPFDYHRIGDGEHVHLFFTGDDGLFYCSRTTCAEFPKGFNNPVSAMRGSSDTVFEGSITYKSPCMTTTRRSLPPISRPSSGDATPIQPGPCGNGALRNTKPPPTRPDFRVSVLLARGSRLSSAMPRGAIAGNTGQKVSRATASNTAAFRAIRRRPPQLTSGPVLPMPLDLPALESWLWEAACVIRGPVDAPKFKDYILPLIFLKRLSDVFEDEIQALEQDFGSHQKALKLAEGQGSSAGEFLTPPEVGRLMAILLDPQPGQTAYDSNCGTAGLLIKLDQRLIEKFGVKANGSKKLPAKVAPLRLFGQEINPATFAMARMNAFIHDMEADIQFGDTMGSPKFTGPDGSLRRFDLVTANPMWNQKFEARTYEADTWGRFTRGLPPTSSADWGWIQHMAASLGDAGRMTVVLDTGAVSRGSGNQGSNKERDIRRAFVEADLIEAVVLLPENLFYNTTAPGIILVLNRRKRHAGQIALINGSKQFSKGRPKNYLEDAHITALADAYLKWRAVDGLSAIVSNADAARNDFNLSPSRYVSVGEHAEVLPLDEAVVQLREAEEEMETANRELEKVLKKLGLGG